MTMTSFNEVIIFKDISISSNKPREGVRYNDFITGEGVLRHYAKRLGAYCFCIMVDNIKYYKIHYFSALILVHYVGI